MLTKADADKAVLDTIKTASGNNDPTAADPTAAYTALLKAAGLKGYTNVGLTTDQLKANNAAITGGKYGQNITLTVVAMQKKPLLGGVKFFDMTNTNEELGYIENVNGKRDEDTNFGKLLAADSNIQGYVGDTMNVTNFYSAVNAQGLQTVYYAVRNVWSIPCDHLKAEDYKGSADSIFSSNMKNAYIFVYKVTLSANLTNNGVSTGTNGNSKTPLFNGNGVSTIGDAGQAVVLQYTEAGRHNYILNGDKFNVKLLAALYEMKSD